MWKALVTLSLGRLASSDSLKELLCADFDVVHADMHDGDQKEVSVSGTSLTIQPSGNDQTWTVQAVIDTTFCNASVDFNVPGKPNPPPVSLTATILLTNSFGPGDSTALKRIVEFTDPSGTLAAASFPLNQWVPVDAQEVAPLSLKCLDSFRGIYADMHDGDQKEVTVFQGTITIKPSGNDQTWQVDADFDTTYCNASIDFNVPGKPSPPPVSLTATLWGATSADPTGFSTKGVLEFTDPSGTLAAPAFPLNHWVEVTRLRAVTALV
jgi:FlaG/FlaF family flagellin (archaellin)